MAVVWTPVARARVAPRRWPDEPRDPSITAEACVHEVRELARRWDEEAERDGPLPARWVKLRAALARCDDGAYASARDARASLGAMPIGLRCALAYAFPHENELTAAVARELLLGSPPKCALKVLPSIADVALARDLALALLRRFAWGVASSAYDFVAAMGDDAATVLTAILDATKEPKTRSPVITALSLIRNETVAAWFAAGLEHASIRRAAAAYFKNAPELATALAATGKKRGAVGRAAKTIAAMNEPHVAFPVDTALPEELPDILKNPPWRSQAEWPKDLVYKNVVPIAQVAGTTAQRDAWAMRLPWIPMGQVVSSGAAWAIAHAFFTRDDAKQDAHAWLLELAEVAAAGLVPMAVGKDARRRIAGRVLRMLVAEGKEQEVHRGIAHYWPEVVRAAHAVLSADSRWDIPVAVPKLPGVLNVDALPPPCLKSGKALPPLGARAVAELLSITSDGFHYVGADEVRAACDEASLERYSWALYEAWEAAGGPTKTRWPLSALGTFGGDAVARELGPRLRGWAQKHEMERATEGVSVLAAIARRGSEVALVQLVNTESGTRFAQLAQRARGALDEIAASRSQGREQLIDRLDAAGDTKADVEALERAQARRLEDALRSQRWWPVADLAGVLLQHAVLRDMVRRIVWRALDAEGRHLVTFHVSADGSCADSADRHVDLSRADRVCIAHPLHLPSEDIVKWSTLFSDYEIVQPFAQLAREVFTPTPDECRRASTERFAHKKVAARGLFALEHHGWGRFGDHYSFHPGQDMAATFSTSPGLSGGSWSDQETSELELTRIRSQRALTFGEIDAVTCSEMFRDLALLVTQ
jgi:hypothetical protein